MTNTHTAIIGTLLIGVLAAMPVMADENVSPAASDEAAFTQSQAQGNVFELLKGHAMFSRFTAIIEQAGMAPLLSGNGPYTVFAPTNAAFARLSPDDQVRLEQGNHATLQHFVKHHIVSAWLTRDQAVHAPRVQALIQQLKLQVTPDAYLVDGQRVVMHDIPATNGLVNIVDGVLMPHFSQPL